MRTFGNEKRIFVLGNINARVKSLEIGSGVGEGVLMKVKVKLGAVLIFVALNPETGT